MAFWLLASLHGRQATKGNHYRSMPIDAKRHPSVYANNNPQDITGGVRSGSGRREPKERKDRNKTLKAINGPDVYTSVEPCVRILYMGGTPKRLFRHRCVPIQSLYAYASVVLSIYK
ncbi:hypothetical protein PIB30_032998 [Stylosanthes scabra]|uniref:Uncharacterized protein n=1 Tax=Stylosanthes scabra TaxID=79078 RepID=A0ABU6TC34_9FABA|nr:hypothetical protein [Stylosanthes scabra]